MDDVNPVFLEDAGETHVGRGFLTYVESSGGRLMKPFLFTMITLIPSGLLAEVSEQSPGQHPAMARTLPPSTRLVTNEKELQVVAASTVKGDLNILVDRAITVNRMIYFPKSESIVRLIGVTPTAAIHFNMAFNGNLEASGTCGISFHCRQAIIRGLQFSGYEARGSAIKGHTTELLDVSACYFHDIGIIQYPHEEKPPWSSKNTVYNQCIGAHNMAKGHISVVGCLFKRCVLNNHSWSHCLYISARSVLVTNNRFIECGNVFQIGSDVPGASNNVFGNEVIRPQAVMDRRGVMRQTYIADLRPDDFTAFMFNKFDGPFDGPWTGHPRAGRHLVDFNDYQGMTYAGSWAADTGRRVLIPWETWRTYGFDNHSSPPEKKKDSSPNN